VSERQRPIDQDPNPNCGIPRKHDHDHGRVGAAVLLTLALSGCATAMSTAPLENTYWKLLRAGGADVVVADGEREPHLVLHPARSTLAGHTGCNRFTLGYTLRGADLVFVRPAPLPAACQSAAATRQQALMLQALERTVHWRVAGQRLELLGSGGEVLAGFESVYLR